MLVLQHVSLTNTDKGAMHTNICTYLQLPPAKVQSSSRFDITEVDVFSQ